jgi:hypothetical protein
LCNSKYIATCIFNADFVFSLAKSDAMNYKICNQKFVKILGMYVQYITVKECMGALLHKKILSQGKDDQKGDQETFFI